MDAKETRLLIALIITAVLLGVIIGFFVVTLIRQLRRNLNLQREKILSEISIMEQERARIAADLHDDLGPLLSATRFQVDYARQAPVVEEEQLQKASEQLNSIIERMRQIANNLMPTALQRKGLYAALEEFTQHIATPHGIRIELKVDPQPLSGEQELQIYRTIQELVHNSVKHSGASLIEISLSSQQGKLKIQVRDNGKGFDVDRVLKESTGIGLRSLQNRASILGGDMTIESKVGAGTAFLFLIPSTTLA